MQNWAMTAAARYLAAAVLHTAFGPSQWFIAALPRPLYVRYRSGCLTVQEDYGDELGEEILRIERGGVADSEMDTATMQRLTAEIIDWGRLQ